MAVKIEIPEDIESCLQKEWINLPRHTLEALAIEGYRTGVLSRSQVRRMLGFETRAEVDEFMKRAGIAFDYTLEGFEHDAETSRYLKEARAKELHGRKTKVHLVDCLIAATASAKNIRAATFDHDFRKFAGRSFRDPVSLPSTGFSPRDRAAGASLFCCGVPPNLDKDVFPGTPSPGPCRLEKAPVAVHSFASLRTGSRLQGARDCQELRRTER